MSLMSASLVNTLTQKEIKSLYESELKQSSSMGTNKQPYKQDCLRTHRSLQAGAYARVQLPASLVKSWKDSHPAVLGVDITKV